MPLNDLQLERYSRNIIVNEIGATGQEKLLSASVLVIGAGGLGSPLLLYLAAAGIGTLGILDNDHVELSNLQRQILHTTSTVNTAKTASAHAQLNSLNPSITLTQHPVRLSEENTADIISRYDFIADGSDNFPTRFLVNRVCYALKKPLVSAAIKGFEGMISTYKGQPCYQCFQPDIPPEGLVPSCTQSGVLGAVAGVLGSLMAVEIVKEILHIGEGLSGRILRYNGLTAAVKSSLLKPDPACPVCRDIS